MIKAHMNLHFPKDQRPDDYLGITSTGINVGPADLDEMITSSTIALLEFWLQTHPDEETTETQRKLTRALNIMTANIIIQKAVT